MSDEIDPQQFKAAVRDHVDTAEPLMSRLLSLIDGVELGIEIAHGQNLRDHGQGDYMRGYRDALIAVRDYIEDPHTSLKATRAYYADDCARLATEIEDGVGHEHNDACENRPEDDR